MFSVSNLSVLGGEEPWGCGPLAGSQGALQHQVGALRGVARHGEEEVPRGVEGARRGEEVVLHGVVGVLQDACLEQEAQGGVQDQEPVLVLEPGRLQQQQQRQRRQLVAPFAASPSSLHI